MRRLLLALVVAVGTSGCVFVLGNPLGFLRGERPLEEKTLAGKGRAKVLLVDLSGVISDQPAKRAFGLVEEESTLGRVKAELAKAAEDDRVKAVVLRIDSPGGGVTASDEIFTELVTFKQKKQVPVVAWFGDVAASGGYYVACASDRIVASPTSVTGSIGVILMSFDLEGLLGKIGVRNETFKAGAHKDLLSPFRAATPEERKIIQAIMDEMHARFVAVVKQGRPRLDDAKLPEITDGRIFGARQALDLGLVDEVGSLERAIDVAKAAAGVERARVIGYQREGEQRETIHAGAPGGAPSVQVNLLPLDVGALAGAGPRFMYLWAPGLVE
jgi:protease-4